MNSSREGRRELSLQQPWLSLSSPSTPLPLQSNGAGNRTQPNCSLMLASVRLPTSCLRLVDVASARWLELPKTPTANHRRPLPFGYAYCGQALWPELCQYIGPCVPPAVVEAFRGNEGESEEDEMAEKEERRRRMRRPLGSLLGHSWGFLGASWGALGSL